MEILQKNCILKPFINSRPWKRLQPNRYQHLFIKKEKENDRGMSRAREFERRGRRLRAPRKFAAPPGGAGARTARRVVAVGAP